MSARLVAQLAAAPDPRAGRSAVARLLAGPYAGGVEVDAAAGVIRNCAVMTAGDAQGHPFECDQTTLAQTLALLLAMPDGARVRLKHPDLDPVTGLPKDGTGTTVGRLRNPRLVGGQIRGDVHLGEYARSVPGQGDARAYLLGQAAEDPAAIGLSCVIHYQVEPGPGGRMPARVFAVDAVDFAERPAANPRGLLSQGPLPAQTNPSAGPSPGIVPHTGGPMDPVLQLLQSLGLDPAMTTPEQVDAFVGGLGPDDKAKAEAAGWKAGWAPTAAMAAGAGGSPTATPTPSPTPPPGGAGLSQGTGAAAAGTNVALLEAGRATQIRQLTATYQLGPEFAQLHVGLGTDVQAFLAAARAELTRRYPPPGTGVASVDVGQDRNVASLGAGISDGIRLRAGCKVDKPHERANEFRGLTLVETCKAYLAAIGVDTRGMNGAQAAQLVFNRGRLAGMARAQLAHTPGDFSNILADTMGKTLRQAYDEQPSNWERVFRRATHDDFRTITRVQLSESPDLDHVPTGGEYADGKLTDGKETYALSKYGKIITVAWETMVNDDLSAFGRIPQLMGMAAKRKEDDVAFYVLLNNPAMADAGLLFNSTAITTAGGHANYTSSGTALSVASLNVGTGLMQVQRGLQQKTYLNLSPKVLLVPPAIAGSAWELVKSTTNPASSNANVKNRFGAGGAYPLDVVEESRLQLGVTVKGSTASGSSTAWYLSADNAFIDTIEVCFLTSEPAPHTEEEDAFRTDGRSYKIRHTVAAQVIDWRGLYKNVGA